MPSSGRSARLQPGTCRPFSRDCGIKVGSEGRCYTARHRGITMQRVLEDLAGRGLHAAHLGATLYGVDSIIARDTATYCLRAVAFLLEIKRMEKPHTISRFGTRPAPLIAGAGQINVRRAPSESWVVFTRKENCHGEGCKIHRLLELGGSS
jgi:hypothetical protein